MKLLDKWRQRRYDKKRKEVMAGKASSGNLTARDRQGDFDRLKRGKLPK